MSTRRPEQPGLALDLDLRADRPRPPRRVLRLPATTDPIVRDMYESGEVAYRIAAAVGSMPADAQRKAVLGGVYGVERCARGKADNNGGRAI